MTIHLWIDPYGYDAFGNVVERGSRATAVLTIRNDDPDLSAPPMYEKYAGADPAGAAALRVLHPQPLRVFTELLRIGKRRSAA